MSNVVFGTNNQGKLNEITPQAKASGFTLLSLSDVGVESDPEETGVTFEENARIKLRSVLPLVSEIDIWVAAEDAGLMIPALGGEPGVTTRRWNGTEMTDQELVDYTLERMADVPYENRSASFFSTVAMAHSTNPEVIKIFTGEVQGKILQKADTTQPMNGLPFRQLFYIPEIDRMLGATEDLPPEKAQSFLTHRQRAFKKMFSYLSDLESIQS